MSSAGDHFPRLGKMVALKENHFVDMNEMVPIERAGRRCQLRREHGIGNLPNSVPQDRINAW